jgi:two-component system sensor histidine kinase VicK
MTEHRDSQTVTCLKVCDLIANAIDSLVICCAPLEIDISYARRNRDYSVFTSLEKLQAIVDTLLHNAVQFAGRGGSLNIEHERIRGKRHNDRSDFIKIGVRICGPGVSQNMFDVVIDKFQNIENMLAEKPPKETSLALTKAQQNIFQIGGNIWIRSDLGRGLTFFFTIPIERQDKEGDAEKAVTIVDE